MLLLLAAVIAILAIAGGIAVNPLVFILLVLALVLVLGGARRGPAL